PLDSLAATGEVGGEFDGVAADLALVRQLHFVALKAGIDAEGNGVALDLPLDDRGLAEHLTGGFAGQLGAVLFEGDGTFDGALRSFGRALPVAADIGGGRGQRENGKENQKLLHAE